MIGAVGGVVVLWNVNRLQCKDVLMGECSLSCLFGCKGNRWSWMFMGVYGK